MGGKNRRYFPKTDSRDLERKGGKGGGGGGCWKGGGRKVLPCLRSQAPFFILPPLPTRFRCGFRDFFSFLGGKYGKTGIKGDGRGKKSYFPSHPPPRSILFTLIRPCQYGAAQCAALFWMHSWRYCGIYVCVGGVRGKGCNGGHKEERGGGIK